MARFNFTDRDNIALCCEELANECDKLARRVDFHDGFAAQAIYSAASCLYDAAVSEEAKKREREI